MFFHSSTATPGAMIILHASPAELWYQKTESTILMIEVFLMLGEICNSEIPSVFF